MSPPPVPVSPVQETPLLALQLPRDGQVPSAQVPGARREVGEAAVHTDPFLEPPESTPGLRFSSSCCCTVRPPAGCGPPPCKVRCGHPHSGGWSPVGPGKRCPCTPSPWPASCSPSGKGGGCPEDQSSGCSRTPPIPGASTRTAGPLEGKEQGRKLRGARRPASCPCDQG